MGGKTGIGNLGMLLASVIALAMSLTAYFIMPVKMPDANYGICLPSPDIWGIPPFLSWIINMILLAGIALLLFLINRSFNFIRSTEPTLPAVFLVATAATPWFSESLNTSNLLCLTNVLSLGIIFSAYEKKNATQQLFVAGVLLGIGSMFQYAFLPMAGLYILWALFMKVLRLKETLAFLVGILCPYWIALGFGFISLKDFHLPSLSPLIGSETDYSEVLFLKLSIGVAAITGFLVSLFNGMKLYAGNSRVNSMNLCISAMGVAALICIFADFENMTAYVVTLYVAMAAQMANICALWNIRHEWVVTAIPSMIYIILFFGSIFL